MKYLCDQMLGTLAKWLRLFGFDTFYANQDITDEKILEISEKEKRILITRDKELVIRAKKKNIQFFKIITIDLDEQLKTVLKNTKIDEKNILSRCSLCNNLVDEIKKTEIKNRVPEKVFENKERFWYCHECDKTYWMGSHYNKIQSKLKEIKNSG